MEVSHDETRRCLRHIVHRASRTASPLSPTRRYCRHENRFNSEDAVKFACSTHTVSHLHTSQGEEDAASGGGLQLLHVFKGMKTSTALFHPYRPQLLLAEATDDAIDYAVSIWGVHRAERLRRLTLDDAMPNSPEPKAAVDALAGEIKRQRAIAEAYE